jgi:hypothetical protein
MGSDDLTSGILGAKWVLSDLKTQHQAIWLDFWV